MRLGVLRSVIWQARLIDLRASGRNRVGRRAHSSEREGLRQDLFEAIPVRYGTRKAEAQPLGRMIEGPCQDMAPAERFVEAMGVRMPDRHEKRRPPDDFEARFLQKTLKAFRIGSQLRRNAISKIVIFENGRPDRQGWS